MATDAYRRWVAAGRPFTLAKPVAELVDWARRNDVPVLGTIGNEEHLQKDEPEDHTPFSATEWPVALNGYIVTAVDLGNVRTLGAKIEAAGRRGELPWLKYMNHSGRHVSFKGTTPVTSPSGDEHVHLSIRTDYATRSIGQFNPWGTTQGEDMPTPAELFGWDGITNPYPDKATNPKMAAATALTNIGGDAYATKVSVSKLAAELAAARADVAKLLARPPISLDRAVLVSVLTEVIGKVDGR